MKKQYLLFLVIFFASCSVKDPSSRNQMEEAPASMAPSQLLEKEITKINQDLASQAQYAISKEDLALIEEEEILSEEEIKEIAKFTN